MIQIIDAVFGVEFLLSNDRDNRYLLTIQLK